MILSLYGPLELRDKDGIDRTPRARKAQGLLALLGTSQSLKRSRGWIQDKLWSDRGPEQGAASLRQCLTELRRGLGPHVDCLTTEAGWVGLDQARVEVLLQPPRSGHRNPDAEFLEGLDVRDPEFEDWLRDQRLARAEAVEASAELAVRVAEPPRPREGSDRPLVIVTPAQASQDSLRLVADMLAEDIAHQIANSGNALVSNAFLPDPGTRLFGLGLSTRAAELGGTLYLQLRLTDLGSGTVIWIDLRELDPRNLPTLQEGPLARLTNEAVAVAVEELGRMGDRVSDEVRLGLLGYQASRHTVLLDRDEQDAMDRMLQRAFELEPRGIFLARRALLRSNQIYEMTVDSVEDAQADAIRMARKALELDPNNAMVVATAAKVAINFESKLHGGSELARKAVELGHANPLAWESMALAHAHAGDAEKAHGAALRAREFASYLPQTYAWDMVCCLTATVAGRYDEAIEFGERARDLAPTFKPPLRYLAALYYGKGDTESARQHLKALKALEPSFSLELLESQLYPVAALRRTPLIRIARSKLI